MVMVSHKHKIIFIKTNKTAGTSTQTYLQSWCFPKEEHLHYSSLTTHCSEYGILSNELFDEPWVRSIKSETRTGASSEFDFESDALCQWTQHMKPRQIRSNLGQERWRDYRKVLGVRNPFARMVSLYHYRLQRKVSLFNDPKLDKKFGQDPKSLDEARRNFRKYIVKGNWTSMRNFFHIKGEYIIDEFFKLENLEEDIVRFSKKYVNESELPKLGTSNDHSGRRLGAVPDYYSPKLTKIVQNSFAYWFERFNYSRNPLDAVTAKQPESENKVFP